MQGHSVGYLLVVIANFSRNEGMQQSRIQRWVAQQKKNQRKLCHQNLNCFSGVAKLYFIFIASWAANSQSLRATYLHGISQRE